MLLHPQVVVIAGSVLVLLTGCFFWIAQSGARRNIGAVVPVFLLGAVLGGFLVFVWHIAMIATGAASWATGGRAERWTAHELEKLGTSWRILHGLLFLEGPQGREWTVDVDHVAVGPGAVLVAETKFCSLPLELDAVKLPKRLREDAAQAANNAQRVRRLVHEVAPDVEVVPLLVYWGRNVTMPTDIVRQIGKVWVVHGSGAAEWRQRLTDTSSLAPGSVEGITAHLEAHAERSAAGAA